MSDTPDKTKEASELDEIKLDMVKFFFERSNASADNFRGLCTVVAVAFVGYGISERAPHSPLIVAGILFSIVALCVSMFSIWGQKGKSLERVKTVVKATNVEKILELFDGSKRVGLDNYRIDAFGIFFLAASLFAYAIDFIAR